MRAALDAVAPNAAETEPCVELVADCDRGHWWLGFPACPGHFQIITRACLQGHDGGFGFLLGVILDRGEHHFAGALSTRNCDLPWRAAQRVVASFSGLAAHRIVNRYRLIHFRCDSDRVIGSSAFMN